VVLIRQKRALLVADALGHLVVGAGVVGLDVGRADDDLAAVGLEERHLFLRDLVRRRADHPVPLQDRGHGQTDAGVARGGLDDRAPGLEQPFALGLLDHGDSDPVFDALARIEILELGGESRPPGAEPGELDQRRVPQGCEDVLVDLHSFSYVALDSRPRTEAGERGGAGPLLDEVR
jgi:hypothetical protein